MIWGCVRIGIILIFIRWAYGDGLIMRLSKVGKSVANAQDRSIQISEEESMNKLIVHIGLPKTGTSTLQKFLALNHEALREQGYSYPDTSHNFENEEVGEVGRYNNGGFVPFVRGGWEPNWDEIFIRGQEMIRKELGEYNVLLVDECIAGISYNTLERTGEDYIRYLKETYGNVHIIVYLRRQDTHFESGWAQEIKDVDFTFPGMDRRRKILMIQEWYKRFMDHVGDKSSDPILSRFYHYYSRLRRMEEIVGAENLHVYTYEEAKEYGLCRHFIERALQLPMQSFLQTENTNVTPSAMAIEVKRRLNKTLMQLSAFIAWQIQKEYWNMDMPFRSVRSKEGHWLEADQRIEILKRFKEDNGKTAERYFQREKLFDETVDDPVARLDKEEAQDNYIKTLEALAERLCYQIKYPPLQKILSAGNKRIAFWGAGYMGRRLIMEMGFPADIILDSDRARGGKEIGGIKIVWTGDFTEWDRYLILITPLEQADIRKRLNDLGLRKDWDYFDIHALGLW